MKTNCHCGQPLDPAKPNNRECKDCARIRARVHYRTKVRTKIKDIVAIDARRHERAEAVAKAVANGATHYTVSYPCSKGHFSERLVSTGQCCECLRIRKRSQRKRDPETTKALARNNYRRTVAKNMGQTRFDSLVECLNGHKGERLVSTGQCCTCLAVRTHGLAEKPRTIPSETKLRILKKGSSKSKARYRKIKTRRYYAEHLSKRTKHKIAAAMRQFVRRLRIQKNGGRTIDILGYSHAELQQRIAMNFQTGMSWENYGEWQIDHVKPIDRFLQQGVSDPRVVNALCNLKPMWAKDNASKGSKFRPPKDSPSWQSSP